MNDHVSVSVVIERYTKHETDGEPMLCSEMLDIDTIKFPLDKLKQAEKMFQTLKQSLQATDKGEKQNGVSDGSIKG